MSKVIVGMSGGVDSAAAAYLLKKAGYDVTGVTLRTWISSDGTESRCCEIDDARKTAWKLDIPYYAFNCLTDFHRHVTAPFINSYIHGRTPNPCVLCNRYVKWERMLYFAKVLQADYIATGHYASVIKLPGGRRTIKKALHSEKDQSYMLYRLTQEQLAATLMPLGNLTKKEVRKIAMDADLPVADKRDSQEICFVPDGNYAGYIEDNSDTPVPKEGFFVDESGNRLGMHKGIIHYTVGQRKGLGLSLGYPAYIKKICPGTNEIVIGDEQSLYCRCIICGELSFMSIPGIGAEELLNCLVKVRYHHIPQEAVIEAFGKDRVKVTFTSPVKAPAPGQSAVFYDKNGCIIGGGIIQDSDNTFPVS